MSKKRPQPVEAVMVASTGQIFEGNHTRCRFSPEIIFDKVRLNWCRISYIHMIMIHMYVMQHLCKPSLFWCISDKTLLLRTLRGFVRKKSAEERNRFIISSWFDMSARQDMGEVSVNHPKSLHPEKGYHSPYHPTSGNRKMLNIDTLEVQSTKQLVAGL